MVVEASFDLVEVDTTHPTLPLRRRSLKAQALCYFALCTTLLTPKKITIFPGTTKVGPICPTFIRGDPYEPHRAHEKVTFSDHLSGINLGKI